MTLHCGLWFKCTRRWCSAMMRRMIHRSRFLRFLRSFLLANRRRFPRCTMNFRSWDNYCPTSIFWEHVIPLCRYSRLHVKVKNIHNSVVTVVYPLRPVIIAILCGFPPPPPFNSPNYCKLMSTMDAQHKDCREFRKTGLLQDPPPQLRVTDLSGTVQKPDSGYSNPFDGKAYSKLCP